MDCILYIDVLFLLNFWMNALVLFIVRQLTKTYRTGWCLLAAVIGAAVHSISIVGVFWVEHLWLIVAVDVLAFLGMVVLAFGRYNVLWHLFLMVCVGVAVAGVFLGILSVLPVQNGVTAVLVGMVSVTAGLFCILLERNSRIRWKEEHMKAKTVLEFGGQKVFATALVDTGNKLYDPVFHKPVILVDEKLMKELLWQCRKVSPERLHYIPFHSVGREKGMLEALALDSVSIWWQEKPLQFTKVIAAATRESLYEGKEYQVIFHCGLLQKEGGRNYAG